LLCRNRSAVSSRGDFIHRYRCLSSPRNSASRRRGDDFSV